MSYALTGTLRDLRSELLVPGRIFTAELLQLTGTPDLIEISGAGRVSDIPFEGRWSYALGHPICPAT